MRDYFHANTGAITKNSSKMIAGIGIILVLPCLLCFISLFFDFRQLYDNSFTLTRLLIIAGCVIIWMVLSFVIYAISKAKVRRQSRFTYFEIQQNNAVLSRYAGSIKNYGKRTFIRQLYVIPFDKVSITAKNGNIIFKGDIRRYEGDSEYLGYHIKRGELEFDNWWYNNNGFTQVKSVVLPQNFDKQKFILRCCKAAQNRSIRIAEKRQAARLAIQTAEKKNAKLPKRLQYKKPVKRIYTEIPTFDRRW